jgi:predicted nucleotidyltransferase
MAMGTEHAGSDVDLAIAGDTRFETNRLIELSTRLSLSCQREVQIRDLQRLAGLILSEVLQKGIIVKHDTVLYAGLMMRMLDYIEDVLPTVRRIREAQLGRFIHGS